MNYNDKYIIELLCSSIFDQSPTPPLDKLDWNYIYEKSKEQNCAGLIYESVSKLDEVYLPSKKILNQWQQITLATVAISSKRYNEFLRMSKILTNNDIRVVGLKGCLLREIYPIPELRTMGDVDVLVSRNDLSRIAKIFKDNNYEVSKDLYGIVCKNDKAYWEIFFSLHAEFVVNTKEWNDKIYNSAKNCYPVGRPDITYFVAHIIIHAARHYMETGAGIRMLADIALVLKIYEKEIDFVELKAICFEQNYKNIYMYLINVMRDYFGLELEKANVKTKNSELFLEYMLLNGVFGRCDNVLLKQVSTNEDDNLRGIRRIFFPPVRVIKDRYRYLKKAPFLLPLAWIQRALFGKIRKETTVKQMIRDLNGALKYSDERMQWMKKLGLKDEH